jgi:hypothetical protein
MSKRLLALLCLALCFASRLPALAAGESRVAVVLLREGGTVAVRVAYPATTTETNAMADLIQAAVDGSWDLTEPQFSRSSTSLTATARIQEIGHDRELTIWPLVGALRRFDEIVVAYVGPSRAGKGEWTNPYVTVSWEAVPTGTTYTVAVHRRDFTALSDLEGKGPPVPPKSSPWLVVLVVGLAVAASTVTYFLARRAVAVAAPETAPSEEEART